MSGKVTRSIEDRLWEKVALGGPEECWPWQAAKDGRGLYGLFYRAGRLVGAHVAAYELVHGPVPSGLEVDHSCNRPDCVNPAHLRPMTRRANLMRSRSGSAENARRTHCRAGHPFDATNTRIDTRGARICRTCDAAHGRARYAKKKEAARCE